MVKIESNGLLSSYPLPHLSDISIKNKGISDKTIFEYSLQFHTRLIDRYIYIYIFVYFFLLSVQIVSTYRLCDRALQICSYKLHLER